MKPVGFMSLEEADVLSHLTGKLMKENIQGSELQMDQMNKVHMVEL